MNIDRRTVAASLAAVLATGLIPAPSSAGQGRSPKAANVVLVHGLFVDGSSWSEVILRLQRRGLNVTAVQNPLTSLPEAVEACRRVRTGRPCWRDIPSRG